MYSEITDLALSSNLQYETVMAALLEIRANTYTLNNPVVKKLLNEKVLTSQPVGIPVKRKRQKKMS